ncbi:hypothetical protein [Tissierella creatinophila]|uniref:Uncharacterized protein n=1 Tax=Tissierella creatinophila DSM 6911 TaxID=1123403 RepID=A0A1U7M6M1_TISCR|nr:hypothetical protein [Tissierella creatinophila]OLS02925.1 hypothetical protein TICRE_10790 [Tissierella creatinophila DSM 6911]
MRSGKFRIWLLNFSILGLMYTLYYFAMRNTAGVLNTFDKLICLLIGTIFIIIIIYNIIIFIKDKQ